MPVHPHFFSPEETDSKPIQYIQTEDILSVLKGVPDHAIVILDIDDTIGRLPYSLGIDPWFIFRIQKYIDDGADTAKAKSLAVELYTQIQLASFHMIPINPSIDIGVAIDSLKKRGVTVIGLTARNHKISDNTHQQLEGLGVSFTEEFINNTHFHLHDKEIKIDKGIIFCNGANKGEVLEKLKMHFTETAEPLEKIVYIDDSQKNCEHVSKTLATWSIKSLVCHYQYRENKVPFTEKHKRITAIQESHFSYYNEILPDETVLQQLSMHDEFKSALTSI